MAKRSKSSLISPMKDASAVPDPGGEFDTGLDFSKEPHEGISAHNVYETEQGSYDGTKTFKSTPMKKVRPVKVDE